MSPTSERWEIAKRLFHEALAADETRRDELLAAGCGDDRELLAEVARMLRAHRDAGAFLESPPTPGAAAADDRRGPPAPSRVGPYRILRELGRGGMARVFLAEQEGGGFRREVAIKLMRRGIADDLFLQRFDTERQILAELEHPGIARLYEGGATDDGLPYFVMEYVEGENLLAWCDSRRLPLADRVRLFLRICAAVEFAHQHLVVHRDLKPSNILVTAQGDPKLLDFGIAKLLQPRPPGEPADVTVTTFRLLTPEYASPEQIAGAPVTTASDVYSLGVLLFELLTGRRPYRLREASVRELERAVCEQEAPKPSSIAAEPAGPPAEPCGPESVPAPDAFAALRGSTPRRLRRLLRGDLDTIVQKALQKDPRRRYATAAELDFDLSRHLAGRPVLARPESVGYRAGKFVSRHRWGVAAAAVAVVALCVGLALSLWQASVARVAQASAERRLRDVRGLANTLLFDAHDAVEKLPGSTSARQLLLERGLRYLDGLAAEARDDPALRDELAAAYLRLGDLQGRLYHASLGDSRAALVSYEKGLALVGEPPRGVAEPGGGAGVGSTRVRLLISAGRVLTRRGGSEQAGTYFDRARELAEAAFAAAPGDPERRQDLAAALIAAADAALDARRLDEAISRLEAARALAHEVHDTAPDGRIRFLAAIVHQRLAVALGYAGRETEALTAAETYLDLTRRMVEREPNDVDARRNLAKAHDMIAWRLLQRQEYEASLAARRESVRVYEQLAERDPANGQALQDLAVGLRELGRGLLASGRPLEATALFRRGREICETLSARDAGDLHLRALTAGFHLLGGRSLLAQDAPAAALVELRRSIEISETLIAADAEAFTEDRRDVAESWFHVGEAHEMLAAGASGARRAELRREAASAYARSLEGFERLAAEGKLGGADLPWLERARAQAEAPDSAAGAGGLI